MRSWRVFYLYFPLVDVFKDFGIGFLALEIVDVHFCIWALLLDDLKV